MFSVVLPTSAESDQAQQIFSTSAASRILVNDLVKIMELKDVSITVVVSGVSHCTLCCAVERPLTDVLSAIGHFR